MLIYAIVSTENNGEGVNSSLAGMNGLTGACLFAVSFNDVSAVVSEVSSLDFPAQQTNAIEYAGVIETLVQRFTLLPVRFGSIMESAEAIRNMLEKNYYGIQQNLIKVQNKFEFGLKIFCDSDQLMAELKKKSAGKTEIPSSIFPEPKKSVYREWVDKKLKEHRLEEMLVAYADSVVAEITESFLRLKTVNKFHKMLTPSTIIDGVLLVDKDRKEELINIVGVLQNQYPTLNFMITGPWPPYNFIDINIK